MTAELRPLEAGDVPAAMALVRQAGWNQTPADWMRFLRAQPTGCFAAVVAGRLVGSVATIIYDGMPAAAKPPQRLAWIGMLIVDVNHRGQGLGQRLLIRALEFLDRPGIPCVKLDATPEGRALYAKHGFMEEQAIERRELVRSLAPLAATEPGQSDASLEDVIRLDRELFGADRGDLLRSLSADAPDLTVVLRADSDVIGYAYGRRGTRADHLGPWMARDAQAGERVLRAFLERSDRPLVYVDCLTNNPWSSRVVEASGFRLSRPLTRLYRGARLFAGRTRWLGAILGPEFG